MGLLNDPEVLGHKNPRKIPILRLVIIFLTLREFIFSQEYKKSIFALRGAKLLGQIPEVGAKKL